MTTEVPKQSLDAVLDYFFFIFIMVSGLHLVGLNIFLRNLYIIVYGAPTM